MERNRHIGNSKRICIYGKKVERFFVFFHIYDLSIIKKD